MKLSAPIYRLKRKAKVLSRVTKAPLHATLDQVAGEEGFKSWSHLAKAIAGSPASELFAQLNPGDLVLLGARPGHGKTLLGLQMVIEGARARRPVFYFSLEEAEKMITGRLGSLGFDPQQATSRVMIDTSDGICADYVIERIQPHAADSLVVIDYLQLLDQRRENQPLATQVEALSAFARRTSSTVLTLSQIDRSFDTGLKSIPDLTDVRLPNQVDLKLFTRTCFLHDGQLQVEALQ